MPQVAAFAAAPDTGMWRDGATGEVVFSVDGTEAARIGPDGISFDGGATWFDNP